MEVSIVCDSHVTIGEEMHCRVEYENTGTTTMSNVRLTALLPGMLQASETVWDGVDQEDIIFIDPSTILLGTLEPGEQGSAPFSIVIPNTVPADIELSTRIALRGETDTGEEIMTTAGSTTITSGGSSTGPMSLQVDVEMTCDNQVIPGGTIHCHVQYKNASNVSLKDAQLTRIAPEEIWDALATQPDPDTEPAAEDPTTTNLGELEPGEEGTFSFALTMPQNMPTGVQLTTRVVLRGETETGEEVMADNRAITTVVSSLNGYYLPLIGRE
jgi:sporulation-control protein spo0M